MLLSMLAGLSIAYAAEGNRGTGVSYTSTSQNIPTDSRLLVNGTEQEIRWSLYAHPDSHRGREVDEHMESELADGAKPVSNGRERNAADTDNTRLEGRDQSGCEERREWLHIRRYFAGYGYEGGSEVCGARWAEFPSVSPVHRGNDGLPFDVDRLTISFGKWRTEALKAYGNAIVPQVMYEIFRAIQQVEQDL